MAPDRARPSMPTRRPGGARSQLWRRALVAAVVGAVAAGLPSPVIASSGGGRRITDAENTRTVYLVVAALVLLAVALAAYTWWFWRSTRRDHDALAPLEVMADRKFADGDAIARQAILDGSRPVGAAPLAPGAPEPLAVVPELAPITLGAAAGDDDETTAVAAPTLEYTDGEAAGDETEVVTGRTPAPGTPPDQPIGDDQVAQVGAADTGAEPSAEEPAVAGPASGDDALVPASVGAGATIGDSVNGAGSEPDAIEPAGAGAADDSELAPERDGRIEPMAPTVTAAPAVPASVRGPATPRGIDTGVAERVGGAATISEALARLRDESATEEAPEERSELPTMAVGVANGRPARDDLPTEAVESIEPPMTRDAAVPMPVIVPAMDPDAREPDPAERPPGAELIGAGNGTARTPIDPGLPITPTQPPPSSQLSLAELAALDTGDTRSFDDDPLRATPSMGVPVVESAEAWVERELAAVRTARATGGGTVAGEAPSDGDGADSTAADIDRAE